MLVNYRLKIKKINKTFVTEVCQQRAMEKHIFNTAYIFFNTGLNIIVDITNNNPIFSHLSFKIKLKSKTLELRK